MRRVAIVGAGGFVGGRYLEMAARDGREDVIPVVRSYRSVARSANLGVRHRVADATRADELARAIAGCDAAVNLTMGDAREVVPITKALYEAAVSAGVGLVVHVSSATVHGPVRRPDLPDDTPPLERHWMPYARAKGEAELFLRERMRDERPAVVVLRPSLIWGPGSPWVLGPANALRRGEAFLLGAGDGVCDLMYVDDLVRSIDAVLDRPAPRAGFYHVADNEMVTWREYYEALARGLGVDAGAIHRLPDGPYRTRTRDLIARARTGPVYEWLKERVPHDIRAEVRRRLARPELDLGPTSGRPAVDRGMWDLQRSRYRRPTARFAESFGTVNRIRFADGMRASLAWLRFIGVADAAPALAAAG